MSDLDVECPKCGEAYVAVEDTRLVTYWGEEGAKIVLCPHCEHIFRVKEHVSRWFEVFEVVDE